jgi:hypothetical protein
MDQFIVGFLVNTQESATELQPTMLQHLQELMMDMPHYTFQRVRAFHGIWMNYLETGRATCKDQATEVIIIGRYIV